MILEPGSKIKITHLATDTSRICLLTKVEDKVIYYKANIKGQIQEMSSNVGPHMKMEWVVQVCDRCIKESNSLIMSMFNTEMICSECKDKERKHPEYENASKIELEHVKNKDYNYKGVGKPTDL